MIWWEKCQSALKQKWSILFVTFPPPHLVLLYTFHDGKVINLDFNQFCVEQKTHVTLGHVMSVWYMTWWHVTHSRLNNLFHKRRSSCGNKIHTCTSHPRHLWSSETCISHLSGMAWPSVYSCSVLLGTKTCQPVMVIWMTRRLECILNNVKHKSWKYRKFAALPLISCKLH